ncbi:hypothetical protein LOZ66_001045 [Ophidiomyces ophidiicola]|nr:hypothetical protein LOZ66_001045 [Ophidiomyces ophidiicola]
MVEKRRFSARASTVVKKRKSEAAPQTRNNATPAKSKAETPARAPSTSESLETLPVKINDAFLLPTLDKPQPAGLSLNDYQSFAESAVVAAALHRSQARWLHNCLFEKYWTKPSRKKGQPPPPNPPKESMTKLGPCTIIIEPHRFDVMLYTVRNPQSHPQVHRPAPLPQKPLIHVQYTAPNGTSNFHQYQPRQPIIPQVRPSLPNSPHPSTAPLNTPATPSQHPLPPLQANCGQGQQTTPSATPSGPSTQPPSRPPTSHGEPSTSTPLRPPDTSAQTPKSNPDPVIQMLATRAAIDPELKALMRVVASSEASQEQLRAFQAHIDELNAIIAGKNRQGQLHSQRENHTYPSQANAAFTPQHSIKQPTPHHIAEPSPKSFTFHSQPQRSALSQPQLPPQPISTPPIQTKFQPPIPTNSYVHQPRPYLQPTKPDVKAVVFEFVTPPGPGLSAPGDRYLLPENMIIDYIPPGTQVIASFLVIKKANASGLPLDSIPPTTAKTKTKKSKTAPASTASNITCRLSALQETSLKMEPTENSTEDASQTNTDRHESSPHKEYYQPITMRILSNNPRTLEPLARVVKPLPEVQRYMNSVMDRMSRAPIRYLAMKLPREKPTKSGTEDDDAVDTKGRAGAACRGRGKSKGGGMAKDDTEDERMRDSSVFDESEDEILDYYEPPNGLVPLKH